MGTISRPLKCLHNNRINNQARKREPLRNGIMLKKLPLVLSLTLAAGSAFAAPLPASYDEQRASREEAAGFFSGALIGGLAGGPPGVIFGAAIGALTGDGFNARRETNTLKAELLAMRMESEKNRERLALAQQQLQALQSGEARPMPAYLPGSDQASCCHNASLSVHFRTGSASIETQYTGQLRSMALMARQMPSVSVEITGYADRSGDAERNLLLSRQRSQAIQQFFSELGIDEASITTVAYGENKPLHETQSLETDFFDRRVTVRLRDSSTQMLTGSPDGQ